MKIAAILFLISLIFYGCKSIKGSGASQIPSETEVFYPVKESECIVSIDHESQFIIGDNYVEVSGTVIKTDGNSMKGFVYSEYRRDEIDLVLKDYKVQSVSLFDTTLGPYTYTIKNLKPGTIYYIRAYMRNPVTNMNYYSDEIREIRTMDLE